MHREGKPEFLTCLGQGISTGFLWKDLRQSNRKEAKKKKKKKKLMWYFLDLWNKTPWLQNLSSVTWWARNMRLDFFNLKWRGWYWQYLPHSIVAESERKVKVKSLSCVRLFATPWTIACQAPSPMGFSRQEYWSGLPFPSPGIILTQGSNPSLPHCRQTLYHLSHERSPD